jgi:hypothetical protein
VTRLITILACAGLLVGNQALPLLHVHVYADHDHPAHEHGPAVHSHGHAPTAHHVPSTPATGASVAPCEPDLHVLSLAAVAATPSSQTAQMAAAPRPPSLFTVVVPPLLQARDQVRAHSPPGLADSPLRAPPSFPLA